MRSSTAEWLPPAARRARPGAAAGNRGEDAARCGEVSRRRTTPSANSRARSSSVSVLGRCCMRIGGGQIDHAVGSALLRRRRNYLGSLDATRVLNDACGVDVPPPHKEAIAGLLLLHQQLKDGRYRPRSRLPVSKPRRAPPQVAGSQARLNRSPKRMVSWWGLTQTPAAWLRRHEVEPLHRELNERLQKRQGGTLVLIGCPASSLTHSLARRSARERPAPAAGLNDGENTHQESRRRQCRHSLSRS